MAKLRKTLESEKVKKVEAITKLTQVMYSRPPTKTGKSTAEPRRQDREIRKLRGELQRETEKLNNLVAKYHKDLEDIQLVSLHLCVSVRVRQGNGGGRGCMCVSVCVYFQSTTIIVSLCVYI